MSANFRILLDGNQKPYYTPGSLVMGCVYVEVKKSITHVREIVAQCVGTASVELIVDVSDNTAAKYSHNNDFYKCTTGLLRRFSSRSELAKGRYEYPFCFQLPADIPPSFQYKGKGAVSYRVTATIKRGFLCSNFKTEQKFYVQKDEHVKQRFRYSDKRPLPSHDCAKTCFNAEPIIVDLIQRVNKNTPGLVTIGNRREQILIGKKRNNRTETSTDSNEQEKAENG